MVKQLVIYQYQLCDITIRCSYCYVEYSTRPDFEKTPLEGSGILVEGVVLASLGPCHGRFRSTRSSYVVNPPRDVTGLCTSWLVCPLLPSQLISIALCKVSSGCPAFLNKFLRLPFSRTISTGTSVASGTSAGIKTLLERSPAS